MQCIFVLLGSKVVSKEIKKEIERKRIQTKEATTMYSFFPLPPLSSPRKPPPSTCTPLLYSLNKRAFAALYTILNY